MLHRFRGRVYILAPMRLSLPGHYGYALVALHRALPLGYDQPSSCRVRRYDVSLSQGLSLEGKVSEFPNGDRHWFRLMSYALLSQVSGHYRCRKS